MGQATEPVPQAHREAAGASARPSASLSDEALLAMYRKMVEIREFEEEVHRRYLQGLIPGTTHLAQGHEAVAVGVAWALEPDDYMTVTYRGHHHCLARGLSPEAMFGELMGRATGVCKGKGGSMHIKDADKGIIGSYAIIGAGIPVAVGAAMSARLRGTKQVAVSFFGDGATNIGAFHEALNIAAVRKAPVIFVCENNLYGEFTRIDRSTPFEDLHRRADAYAMPGVPVDGNDVLAVYDAVVEAAARARRGEGPTFIECKTYRHRGHSRTDPATYRPKEEVEWWLARDPIPRFAEVLQARGIIDAAGIAALREEIVQAVQAAAEAAASAPWPDLSQLTADVYA